MKLPVELFLQGIEEKKVYYFTSNKISTDNPHYYVCIKRNNDVLILTLCTSQIEKKQRYIELRKLPYETLVFIKNGKTKIFNKDTCINCNEIHQLTIDEFVNKYKKDEIESSGFIDDNYYDQIIVGIHKSPIIEEEIKDLIPKPESYK